MEYTVLVTFASTADLLDPILEITFACNADLEAIRFGNIAAEIILEKETQKTLATFEDLHAQKEERIAVLSNLEKVSMSTIASKTILEEEGAFKTFASKTVLEKIGRSTFAIWPDFGWTPSPEESIVEVFDLRNQSAYYPVARWRGIITIPAGQTARAQEIKIDGRVVQIVVKRPITAAVTTTITITDELDAVLFTQATLSSNASSALITTEQFIPLAGINECTLLMSGTLSAAARFVVEIFVV